MKHVHYAVFLPGGDVGRYFLDSAFEDDATQEEIIDDIKQRVNEATPTWYRIVIEIIKHEVDIFTLNR